MFNTITKRARDTLRQLWPRFNYLLLAREKNVKLAGLVNLQRGVDIYIGKNASVVIGKGVIIGNNAFISVFGDSVLEISDNVFLAHGATLSVAQSVKIGAETMIGEYVSIRDHDHDYNNLKAETLQDRGLICAPVQIGRNVWIGAKATIIKGVIIGDNAVVGANSVVTKDVQANTLVVGAPAKAVKKARGCATL